MKRATKLALQTLAAIFGSAAILFAVLAWRLSAGPISLSFLSPYLADAFEAEDLSYRVEFSDTILSWAGWDRSLDILVRDVRVRDAGGILLGTVPELSLGLSGLQLLRGKVSPTMIELLRPQLFLHRSHDGTISFGFGGAAKASGPSDPAFGNLLGGVVAARDPSRPLGLLSEVSVREAEITLEDESLGLILHAPKSDIVLRRTPEGLAGTIEGLARLGELEIPLSGTATYDRASASILSKLRFAEINPAQIAAMMPQLSDLDAVDMPISGEIELALDTEGRIGRTAFEFSGERGRITAPTVLSAPLDVTYAQAKGEISADRRHLTLDDLFVDFGGPSLAFAGVVENAEAGIGVHASINLNDLPFDELGRYWPVNVAPGGREWIAGNVSVGTMRRITGEFSLEPGRLAAGALETLKPGELSVDFEFADATMNYLKSTPKVLGVDGEGHTDGLTMSVTMRDGTVGGVRATRGTAEMRDMTAYAPTMTVVVELEGGARDALELLDAPRFRYASKVGLTPAQVSGQVRAQMGAQFLLLKRLTMEELAITSTATIEQFAVDGLFSTFKATDGTLKVAFDSAREMTTIGTLKLEGVPAKVSWLENLKAGASYLSRYEFEMMLDDEARKRLGLELSSYLTGPLPAVIRYTDIDRKRREVSAAFDARGATIRIPELFWEKPPDQDASLVVDVSLPQAGGGAIRSFALQARDARFEGRGELDPSLAGIKVLEITRMLLGLTDASARITPAAGRKGPLHIEIGGESLDIRPYLKDLLGESREPVTDLELDLDVKRVITRTDQQITGARGRAVFGAEGLNTAYLEGTLISGAPLRIRLEPDGKRRRLVAQSDDAGSVARAFDVYDNAIGGKLYLEATIFDDAAGEPVEGFVQIDNYKVRNAPALANLLAFASLTGIVDVLQGDGLSFDQFYMPFTVFDDLLTVKDARSIGASLGVTASGTVNLDTDATDLSGTIVPMYAFNSALGSIPVIGDILTGGEGGGLFAATFSVDGPIEEPTITVNPLAALAPGIFRKLFEGGGKPAEPQKESDR